MWTSTVVTLCRRVLVQFSLVQVSRRARPWSLVGRVEYLKAVWLVIYIRKKSRRKLGWCQFLGLGP